MVDKAAYGREYHANPVNKERKKYKRALRGPVHRRNERLKLHWKMKPEEYEARCESQHHRCAICGKRGSAGMHQKLYIDHDHRTGQIRGMLCNSCNRALGLFKDDIGLLQMALDYLTVP